MSMRTTEIEVRDPNTDTIPLDVRFDPETQIGELSHYLVSQDGSEIIITYAMAESLFSAVKRLEMCRPARVEETWQSNWKTEKPVLLPVSAEAIRAEALAEHKCGGCAKTAADGWALYCVECWEKAEPVKQELVCKTCESLARTVMMDQTGKA